MSTNIYSNAFNFSSYFNGAVDLRTGQFSSVFKLASIRPEGSIEASRDINLSFSMMNNSQSNSVGGIGWTLNKTELNANSKTLRLLSGESFKIDGLPVPGYKVSIKDRKLKDIVVKRASDSTIEVFHKDGTTEILTYSAESGTYRLTSIIFENGEEFLFKYTSKNLLEIVNKQNLKKLLEITYSGGTMNEVKTLGSGGKPSSISFNYSNYRLLKIIGPYNSSMEDKPIHIYEYISFDDGSIGISAIKNPMGGREEITYQKNGHRVDNKNATPYYLPYVKTWKTFPGASQPYTNRLYTYSANNFSGYPYNSGYIQGEDNIYLSSVDYLYWGEEKTVDQNNIELNYNKTTYNKFHLLKEEIKRRGSSKIIETTLYNQNDQFLGDFSKQPANLQLAKQITTRYESQISGEYREEVIKIETDDYGNVISKTENSGVKHAYSYYPIEGEGSLCPAEPRALFQRYCKQESIIPATNDVETRITQYEYTRLSSIKAGNYFVLVGKSKFITPHGDVTNQSVYVNNTSNPVLHGRLEAATMTIGNQATVTAFNYAISNNVLIETRRITAPDTSWSEISRNLDIGTNQLSNVCEEGKNISFNYDVLGRVIEEIDSPRTDNEAKRSYSYQHYNSTTNALASLTVTDALGKKYITRYDGKARPVSIAEIQKDNSEQIVKVINYNVLGQTVKQTTIDRIYNKQSNRTEELPLVYEYQYNDWEELKLTVNPDKSTITSDFDLIKNIRTERIGSCLEEQALSTIKTFYNKFGQIEKVTQTDSSNKELTIISRSYDGFGRCKTEAHVDECTTEYSYDYFNRVITVVNKSKDGKLSRTVATRYANHTTSKLISSIEVNGQLIGAREYDGIGRIIKETIGGENSRQTKHFTYGAGSIFPKSSVCARGIEKTYSYNKELEALTAIQVNGSEKISFSYCLKTGKLINTKNNNANCNIEYDSEYQHRKKETLYVTGINTPYESIYQYSPAGRMLNYTSCLGDVETREYDSFGRLAKILMNDSSMLFAYDNFGRTNLITAKEKNLEVKTRITFDSFDREYIRSTELNGIVLQTLTSKYYDNGLLATKTIKDDKQNVISEESFVYDAYRRLTSYQCTGQCPSDFRGRNIRKQEFVYDIFNNITKVTTYFVDGTENITIRSFSRLNPTQLEKINHSNPVEEQVLQYDESGNMLVDQKKRTFEYDDFNKLVSVSLSGKKLCEYKYDAQFRQIAQSPSGEASLQFYYNGDSLIGEKQGDIKLRYKRDDDKLFGRTIQEAGKSSSEINIIDQSGTVKEALKDSGGSVVHSYTPYGESKIDGSNSSLPIIKRSNSRFNGQRLDPLTNLYHLGNGRRAYSPELMIFCSPDPLSPFGQGGLNCYSYCNGDPINNYDPSGLASESSTTALRKSVFGLVIGLVAFTIAVVAAVPTGGASLSILAVMGAVGAGIGVVAGTIGVASAGMTVVDEDNGWNRTQQIENLNLASSVLGAVSFMVALGTSVAGGFNAAAKSPKTKYTFDTTARTGVPSYSSKTDSRIGSGLSKGFSTLIGYTPECKVLSSWVGLAVLNRSIGSIHGMISTVSSRINNENETTTDNSQGDSRSDVNQESVNGLSDSIGSSMDLSNEVRKQSQRIRGSNGSEIYSPGQ